MIPWVAGSLLTLAALFAITTAGRTIQCPISCQCSTQYYVYCQEAAITDAILTDIIAGASSQAVLLDLSSNLLTKIPKGVFDSLPNLEYLNLAANSIVEIPENAFQGLPRLKDLKLHKNKISFLTSGSFNGLRMLKDLHLEDNEIPSIPIQTFGNLPVLEKLQLQKNRIVNLQSGTFLGLENLELLNINENLLSSISGFTFSGLKSLKRLVINDNRLSNFSLDAFSGLVKLEILEVQRNNISEMLFMHGNDFYPSLTSVSIAGNHIISLPSHVLPHNVHLRHVDLSSNRIRRIGGHSFNNLYLETLSLQNNNLSEINRDIFKSAKRIANLNLSQNQIHNIETGAFDSFRETLLNLDLKSNRMTYVHSGMFRGMCRLWKFNLAANQISVMDPGSFKDMVKLEELNLSRNKFNLLSSKMISGPEHLRKLYLVCNPLHKMTGFTFDRVSDRIFIESNSTMVQSTTTTVLITWPYKDGTQLYWSLSVTCVGHLTCQVPSYESTLRPYVTQVKIAGLTPGSAYFVCVMPVFLSPDVHVSQCVHVTTQVTSGENFSRTPQPRSDDHTTSISSSLFLLSSASHVLLYLLPSLFFLQLL